MSTRRNAPSCKSNKTTSNITATPTTDISNIPDEPRNGRKGENQRQHLSRQPRETRMQQHNHKHVYVSLTTTILVLVGSVLLSYRVGRYLRTNHLFLSMLQRRFFQRQDSTATTTTVPNRRATKKSGVVDAQSSAESTLIPKTTTRTRATTAHIKTTISDVGDDGQQHHEGDRRLENNDEYSCSNNASGYCGRRQSQQGQQGETQQQQDVLVNRVLNNNKNDKKTITDRAYYEALVHPAMLVNEYSESVLIIVGGDDGGGSGGVGGSKNDRALFEEDQEAYPAGEGRRPSSAAAAVVVPSLREVLKHKTVQDVTVLIRNGHHLGSETDHGIGTSGTDRSSGIPEWNDCSDIRMQEGDDKGTTASSAKTSLTCLDDPRVTVHRTDSVSSWLAVHGFASTTPATTLTPNQKEREEEEEEDNGDDDNDEEEEEEDDREERGFFDVIIFNGHPRAHNSAVEELLQEDDLVPLVCSSLTLDGVVTIPIGNDKISTGDHPTQPYWRRKKGLIDRLKQNDIEQVITYAESTSVARNSRLHRSHHNFLIGFRDVENAMDWMLNEAELQLKIRRRVVKTKEGGSSPFAFFDAATILNHWFPTRIDEEVHCRIDPEVCAAGHGLDPWKEAFPGSALEVRISGYGESSGRGVYAKTNIPEGSYLGLDYRVHSMYIPSPALTIMYDMLKAMPFGFWKTFVRGYVDGYGWSDYLYDIEYAGIEPGILTFCNHGCNGTYNVGFPMNITEQDAPYDGLDMLLKHRLLHIYNPFVLRQYPNWGFDDGVVLRDIRKDEEVLDNYAVHSGFDPEDVKATLSEVRSWCTKETVGMVFAYETDPDEIESHMT